MPAAGLAKVGVEAVVGGLSSFLGDIGKVDSSIKNLVGSGNLVSRAFSSLGNVISGLIGSVFRVLEYTLGNLLAGAIRGVIGWVKELADEVIASTDAFQKMEVRLNRFNLNEIKDQFDNITDAQAKSIEMTKDQIRWLGRLAARTPFDAEDIAQSYSLARSYGFGAEEAKGLTEEIANFASGMGLTSEHIERIIINFGQMKAAGKITGTEIRDLARGAFVPVNRILDDVAENLGITREELDKLRKKGLSDAETFFAAFSGMVNEDFMGAATDMNTVLSVATNNIRDMLKYFISLGVVKDIFASLATRVSEFQSALYERWDQIEAIVVRISAALTGIVEGILGVTPSAEEMADTVVLALEGIAGWLEQNKDGIIKWVQDSAKWVRDELVPALERAWTFLFGEEGKQGAIQKFGEWLQYDLIPFVKQQVLPVLADLNEMLFGEKKTPNASGSPDDRMDMIPTDDLATSISEIDNTPLQNLLKIFQDLQPALDPLIDLLGELGGVLIVAFGGSETEDFGVFVRDTLVPALTDLATWVGENKEGLALLLKAFLAMQVIFFLVGIILQIIGAFVTFTTVSAIIGIVVLAVRAFINIITFWRDVVMAVIAVIVSRFNDFKNNVAQTFNEVMSAIKNKDWLGVGRALVDGIWRGLQQDWNRIITLAQSLGKAALDAFKRTFNIKSPSGEMWDIGEQVVAGLAQGIKDSTGMAVASMQKMAVATLNPMVQMSMKAMPATTSTTNNYNYNLNVNTSARAEPIVADFAMLETLAA